MNGGHSVSGRVATLRLGALLILLSRPVWPIEVLGVQFNGLEAQGGIGYILNAVGDSGPDPFISLLGLSLPLRFPNSLTFRPEFTFYTHPYAFQDGRAVPMEPMFDSVLLLGVGIFPWFGQEFDLQGPLTAGWEITVGFVPRFPVFFIGQGGSQALDITSWFLAGRFLYPAMSGFFTWKFSELFRLTTRLHLLIPVFNLWTPTALWDQLQSNLLVGIRWDF